MKKVEFKEDESEPENIIDEKIVNQRLQLKLHQQMNLVRLLKKDIARLKEKQEGQESNCSQDLEEMKTTIRRIRVDAEKQTMINILKRSNRSYKNQINLLQNQNDNLEEHQKTLCELYAQEQLTVLEIKEKLAKSIKDSNSYEDKSQYLQETSISDKIKIEGLQEQLITTKRQLETCQGEAKTLGEELNEAKSKIREIENLLTEQKEKNDQMQLKLENSVKSTNNTRDLAIANLKQEHEHTIELLRKEAKDKATELESVYNQEVDSLESAKVSVEKKLDESNKRLNDLTIKFDLATKTSKNEQESLTSQFDDQKRLSKNENAILSRHVKELEEQNNNLINEKKQINDKLQNQERELNLFKEDSIRRFNYEINQIGQNLLAEEKKSSQLYSQLNDLQFEHDKVSFELKNMRETNESMKINQYEFVRSKEQEIGKLKEELSVNKPVNRFDHSGWDK